MPNLFWYPVPREMMLQWHVSLRQTIRRFWAFNSDTIRMDRATRDIRMWVSASGAECICCEWLQDSACVWVCRSVTGLLYFWMCELCTQIILWTWICSQNNFTDVQVRWIDGRVHCSFVRPVSTTFYTYKYSRYGGQTINVYNDLVSDEYYLFVASGDVYPGMLYYVEVNGLHNTPPKLWPTQEVEPQKDGRYQPMNTWLGKANETLITN